jgi:hypothetical protein
MIEYCTYCKKSFINICVFNTNASLAAQDPDSTPAEKHKIIARMRHVAQEMNCPQVNKVNPYYKGREKL